MEVDLLKDGKPLTVARAAINADWSALLTAAQAGDADAYRRFLGAVVPFVRTVARRRCWSEDQAEDVVQDVLLTIHRVRHTYEPGRPVKPWLTAITVRRAIDATRKRGRVSAREVFDEHAYETFADPGANQEVDKDAPKILAGMTAGLTRGQKEAIDLVKVKEMSLAEASAFSGQTVASLKVNIHRAIKKMRLDLLGKSSE
uniref:sigma-70 family RNA polymerase sigma factor n=1 Tax=uncultured Sphingomonas sp. TaxID=158754 RepID=UPI0025D92631|nr:sigma-70 family RNA polymerase sigma factor [uncultured Sphingomonas sp.]